MVIFRGKNGVRAGWRFLLFAATWYVLDTYVFGFIENALPDGIFAGLSPEGQIVGECFDILAVLGATGLMALLERRSILAYGFTPRTRALPQLAEGVALGVGSTLAVALLMVAFGGMRISGFALHGIGWLYYPLMWGFAMILVGFSEEATFRGYPLFALSRGIGFWPAAIVLTALFGGAHLGKTGENAVDIASVVLLGLFTCFALWKTGTLWLVVGFHAAFDFMQFFVIGTRNGSQVPIGSLFNATFPGPAWVNGGALGTEASYFAFPVTLALFAYIALRYRGAAAFKPPE